MNFKVGNLVDAISLNPLRYFNNIWYLCVAAYPVKDWLLYLVPSLRYLP